jgi:hypothetical protein
LERNTHSVLHVASNLIPYHPITATQFVAFLSLTFLPSLVRESFQQYPFHSLTPPSLAPLPRPAHLDCSKPVTEARSVPTGQSAFRLHERQHPDTRSQGIHPLNIFPTREGARSADGKELEKRGQQLVIRTVRSLRRVHFQRDLSSHTPRQPTKICSRIFNSTQHPQDLVERQKFARHLQSLRPSILVARHPRAVRTSHYLGQLNLVLSSASNISPGLPKTTYSFYDVLQQERQEVW